MKSSSQLFTAKVFAVAAALICIMSPASADVIGLTFEGVANNVAVLDFYNGGADGGGNTNPNAAENYGVSFGSDSLALLRFGVGGGTGNFENEPSPDTVLYFDNPNGSAVLNFAAGFDTGFSFFYSARLPLMGDPNDPVATVTIWDDVGGSAGTGSLLGTIDLFENWQTGCTPSMAGLTDFCNWDPIGAAFDGIARSIEFGGTALLVGYDNITFGSIDPVPLPAGVWLLLSGLFGIVAMRRRRACA
jgi:hypothetical protein